MIQVNGGLSPIGNYVKRMCHKMNHFNSHSALTAQWHNYYLSRMAISPSIRFISTFAKYTLRQLRFVECLKVAIYAILIFNSAHIPKYQRKINSKTTISHRNERNSMKLSYFAQNHTRRSESYLQFWQMTTFYLFECQSPTMWKYIQFKNGCHSIHSAVISACDTVQTIWSSAICKLEIVQIGCSLISLSGISPLNLEIKRT